ncbi:hypothetical protein [Antarcticirhabdus aurantiaca]|uniref:Uncharacterized protein n=1 Tax=Antarcticirhabdus aurantiaca TaxID=2606717 RepID=A0ACD4NQ25_9HYPH|nr:hypothetical protein [Antarcticirhabdus aurantiaca]WAJ28843.1 hypothetical protein OXU80_00905 [Jeongeuplla avenae]
MSVADWVGRVLKVVQGIARPAYRPELHYMRGPGPACMRRSASGER